ncbi:hypothetical protein [Burkholderia sp. 9120]|uniref:hypothetical protein n=1 Tax=Burkholderia sp. 9120 TaxID=1500897 RepID=UPI00054EC788|nr:hypothetical protein [Burkholderia sp. 9120]
MATNLIKARHGVYGRKPTDQEREQLERFARDYVASSATHSEAEAKALRRLTKKMLTDPKVAGAHVKQFRSEGFKEPIGGSAKAHSDGFRKKAAAPDNRGVKRPAKSAGQTRPKA